MKRFFRLYAPEGDDSGGGGGAPPAPPAAPAPDATTLLVDPAAAPTDAPWINTDGSFSADWTKRLPAELQTPALAPFTKVEDLAKSYLETKAMVGKKLAVPGADAPPEAQAAWRKLVGAPDTAEGYGSLKPEAIPAEMWDGAGETELKAVAHKHNLTTAAVQDIIGIYAKQMGTASQQAETQQAEYFAGEKTKLEQAWGANFSQNANQALMFAAELGIKADHPIMQSAEVVQAFQRGAQLHLGDKIVTGATAGGAVQNRIADMQDPKSSSREARAYRGEMGAEEQAKAQAMLHSWFAASKK